EGSWRKHGAVRVIKVKLLGKQGVNVGNERVSTWPWETLELLGLVDDPVFLGPVPKLRELRRRCTALRELFPMLNQHFREIHSIGGDAVRIRAAFEQMQRICILAAVMKPILGGVKQ